VIAVIEPLSFRAYEPRMRSVALRLLTFFAVLLMPFSMSPAPADTHHRDVSAAMQMEHCPEGQSKTDGSGALHSCTMACSAALPAADFAPAAVQQLVRTPTETWFAPALAGVEIEIDTPPPRRS